MKRLPLSPAACGLLRSLLHRCGEDRDRILLIEFRSIDWQSLTFVGERHEIALRVIGPDPDETAGLLLQGLNEDELDLRGHVVAEICTVGAPIRGDDGSLELRLEALTLRCD